MDKEQFTEWKAKMKSVPGKGDWKVDVIHRDIKGDLIIYREDGEGFGYFLGYQKKDSEERGELTMGTYEGGIPHIGEALFNRQVVWTIKVDMAKTIVGGICGNAIKEALIEIQLERAGYICRPSPMNNIEDVKKRYGSGVIEITLDELPDSRNLRSIKTEMVEGRQYYICGDHFLVDGDKVEVKEGVQVYDTNGNYVHELWGMSKL